RFRSFHQNSPPACDGRRFRTLRARQGNIHAAAGGAIRPGARLMRIVIDLQGAQSTGSRHRGIGRYSMALAKAMARNRGAHEIVIALSDLFPETVEPIIRDFEGLLPRDAIRVWTMPGPVAWLQEDNDWRRRAAELVRETFLAS